MQYPAAQGLSPGMPNRDTDWSANLPDKPSYPSEPGPSYTKPKSEVGDAFFGASDEQIADDTKEKNAGLDKYGMSPAAAPGSADFRKQMDNIYQQSGDAEAAARKAQSDYLNSRPGGEPLAGLDYKPTNKYEDTLAGVMEGAIKMSPPVAAGRIIAPEMFGDAERAQPGEENAPGARSTLERIVDTGDAAVRYPFKMGAGMLSQGADLLGDLAGNNFVGGALKGIGTLTGNYASEVDSMPTSRQQAQMLYGQLGMGGMTPEQVLAEMQHPSMQRDRARMEAGVDLGLGLGGELVEPAIGALEGLGAAGRAAGESGRAVSEAGRVAGEAAKVATEEKLPYGTLQNMPAGEDPFGWKFKNQEMMAGKRGPVPGNQPGTGYTPGYEGWRYEPLDDAALKEIASRSEPSQFSRLGNLQPGATDFVGKVAVDPDYPVSGGLTIESGTIWTQGDAETLPHEMAHARQARTGSLFPDSSTKLSEGLPADFDFDKYYRSPWEQDARLEGSRQATNLQRIEDLTGQKMPTLPEGSSYIRSPETEAKLKSYYAEEARKESLPPSTNGLDLARDIQKDLKNPYGLFADPQSAQYVFENLDREGFEIRVNGNKYGAEAFTDYMQRRQAGELPASLPALEGSTMPKGEAVAPINPETMPQLPKEYSQIGGTVGEQMRDAASRGWSADTFRENFPKTAEAFGSDFQRAWDQATSNTYSPDAFSVSREEQIRKLQEGAAARGQEVPFDLKTSEDATRYAERAQHTNPLPGDPSGFELPRTSGTTEYPGDVAGIEGFSPARSDEYAGILPREPGSAEPNINPPSRGSMADTLRDESRFGSKVEKPPISESSTLNQGSGRVPTQASNFADQAMPWEQYGKLNDAKRSGLLDAIGEGAASLDPYELDWLASHMDQATKLDAKGNPTLIKDAPFTNLLRDLGEATYGDKGPGSAERYLQREYQRTAPSQAQPSQLSPLEGMTPEERASFLEAQRISEMRKQSGAKLGDAFSVSKPSNTFGMLPENWWDHVSPALKSSFEHDLLNTAGEEMVRLYRAEPDGPLAQAAFESWLEGKKLQQADLPHLGIPQGSQFWTNDPAVAENIRRSILNNPTLMKEMDVPKSLADMMRHEQAGRVLQTGYDPYILPPDLQGGATVMRYFPDLPPEMVQAGDPNWWKKFAEEPFDVKQSSGESKARAAISPKELQGDFSQVVPGEPLPNRPVDLDEVLPHGNFVKEPPGKGTFYDPIVEDSLSKYTFQHEGKPVDFDNIPQGTPINLDELYRDTRGWPSQTGRSSYFDQVPEEAVANPYQGKHPISGESKTVQNPLAPPVQNALPAPREPFFSGSVGDIADRIGGLANYASGWLIGNNVSLTNPVEPLLWALRAVRSIGDAGDVVNLLRGGSEWPKLSEFVKDTFLKGPQQIGQYGVDLAKQLPNLWRDDASSANLANINPKGTVTPPSAGPFGWLAGSPQRLGSNFAESMQLLGEGKFGKLFNPVGGPLAAGASTAATLWGLKKYQDYESGKGTPYETPARIALDPNGWYAEFASSQLVPRRLWDRPGQPVNNPLTAIDAFWNYYKDVNPAAKLAGTPTRDPAKYDGPKVTEFGWPFNKKSDGSYEVDLLGTRQYEKQLQDQAKAEKKQQLDSAVQSWRQLYPPKR